jgi:hypothetical protein
MLYYYISSICCTVILWKRLHDEKNKELLENDLEAVSKGMNEYDFTRDDALVSLYIINIFFSFVLFPYEITKKLAGSKNVQ